MASDSNIPTPATPDVVTLTILIDDKKLDPTFSVHSLSVLKEVNRIPMAIIVLSDGDAAKQTFEASNKEEFIPGKKIEIKAGYKAQEDTIFKGMVISQNLKIRQNNNWLTVECRDEICKLNYDRLSKYYVNQKDSQILGEVLDKYKFKINVEATTLKHKEMVQFEATDWDFVITRCDANGFFCMVDDGEVKIGKPAFNQEPQLSVSFGSNILELDVEMDSRYQIKSSKSQAWHPSDQKLSKAEAIEPETSEHGNLKPSDLAKAIASTEEIQFHSGNVSDPELQQWADARLLRHRMAKTCGRVKFQGYALIKPGMILEIGKLGERFEGDVWVSAVRHEIADGNWLTDVQFGLPPQWHVEKHDLRPRSAGGLLPPIGGLHIGVVTKIENDPDGEDRIQLRLPVISTVDDGIWARVATLDAGNKRGSFFRPELNDEVVVGFLDDDPRHPVVLGMCNSSAKPAPHQPKDTNHMKGFVTRSGMKLWFDDEKKIALIETPTGNKMMLTEEDKGISIQDQNENKIVLDPDGIRIVSSKDIILKANNDIKMDGVNINLKATANFSAEATSGATLKANATATLEGNTSAVVKGATVLINS